jgi:biopolymer transport protein TolR
MAFNPGNGAGEDLPPLAEINIIPLVDVMLVLLIISMVTAPFLEQGVNVQLPVANGQSLQKEQQEEPLVLFVSKDNNIRLGNKPITRSELGRTLGQIFSKRSNRELFVRADKDVPYGVVAEIMARVQAAGVERVGLVTQPE